MKYTDYWDHVVMASNDVIDRLGAFPPPRLLTVAAAEIIKLLLKKARYDGTMACSVVQLQDLINGQQTFVVAFSGYHPKLHLDLTLGTAELREAFEDLGVKTHLPPRFWYRHAPPGYYVPLHQQTRDYFSRNLLVTDGISPTRTGVDVSRGPISWAAIARERYLDFEYWKAEVFEGQKQVLSDITTKKETKEVPQKSGEPRTISYDTYKAVYGANEGPFSYDYKGTADRPKVEEKPLKLDAMFKKKGDHVGKAIYEIGVSFAQKKPDILRIVQGMLATFLAIRMDLIAPANVPDAVRAARTFIRALKETKVARLEKLAAYLDRVLSAPRLSREQLDLEVTMKGVREENMKGMIVSGARGPDRLTRRERAPLKEALKLRHWKEVPTERKVQPTDLILARNRLRPPVNGDLVSAREALLQELRDDAIFGEVLPQLWAASGAGPNGQFCAEPKAFDYVRNGVLIDRGIDEGKSRAVVVGQLAFWYSGGPAPRPFSEALLIIGPADNRKASNSGGYMLPCSSCAARSALMMEGVTLKSNLMSSPTLFVSQDTQIQNRCVVCWKSTKQVCGRCRAVFYCNKEHQVHDWKRHKPFCAPSH